MAFPRTFDWRVTAPALVLAAGTCWGFIGLFSHMLSEAGLGSVQITVVRCVVTSAVIGLFLVVFDRRAFRVRVRDLWMFAGTGVLSIAFFNVCYFACMQMSGLSLAAILLYTAPCFVVVMSAAFFKERITRQKLVALGLAFCGCVLVIGIGTGTAMSILGIAAGLGSGIGYALYSIFARVSLKHYGAHTVTFYTFLFAAVVLIPFSQPEVIVAAALDSSVTLAAMLALAIVSTVVPFACYTVGLEHIETGRASIMAFVEPMVALVIGVAVFGEPFTALNCVGVAFILSAIVLLNVRFRSA